MLVLDREAAIAAWRRAESRIYPSVMLNADLYQQYIGMVRAIAVSLSTCPPRSGPEKVSTSARAWAALSLTKGGPCSGLEVSRTHLSPFAICS